MAPQRGKVAQRRIRERVLVPTIPPPPTMIMCAGNHLYEKDDGFHRRTCRDFIMDDRRQGVELMKDRKVLLGIERERDIVEKAEKAAEEAEKAADEAEKAAVKEDGV